jgi:anti-anti-sigma factor
LSLLDLKTESNAGTARVALAGELDISSAARLQEELDRVEASRPETLLLDLRSLEFMDSTGLRLILGADARARDDGRRLVLVRGPEAVQRVFSITKLDERLTIVDDPSVL